MNKIFSTDEELKDWITKVSTEFYERTFKHPWLKDVFAVIRQEVITSQQIDFMVQALGGPKNYAGRTPSDAHPHIFIDEEMWQVREDLLIEAFNAVNAPEELRKMWLRIDEAFKRSIVMKSPSECVPKIRNGEIIVIPNPMKKSA